MVVLSHRHAAGQHDDVGSQRFFDSRLQLSQVVRHVAQDQWFATHERDLGGERNTVAVADLKFLGWLVHTDDFVAGGKNRDTRLFGHHHARTPYLRRHGQLAVAQALAALDHALAHARFLAFQNKMRTRMWDLFDNYVVAFDPRVLDHHDGIGAARHGRAGHDVHAGARFDCAVKRHARAAFAN